MIKKIFKYRRLIFNVLIRTVYYRLLIFLFSDKAILKKISKKDFEACKEYSEFEMQPTKRILRQTDRIINRSLSNTSCLARSLVKRDILTLYGVKSEVCFGILKEDDELRAHSWISIEDDSGYLKVFELS